MTAKSSVVPVVGLTINIKLRDGDKSMNATILKIQEKDIRGSTCTQVLLDEFFDPEVFGSFHVSDLYCREDSKKWFCSFALGHLAFHMVEADVSIAV